MLFYVILTIAAAGILLASETGRALLERLVILIILGGLIFLGFWAVAGDGFLDDRYVKLFVAALPVLIAAFSAVFAVYSAGKILAKIAARMKTVSNDPGWEKLKPQPSPDIQTDESLGIPTDESIENEIANAFNLAKNAPQTATKNAAEEIKEIEIAKNFSLEKNIPSPDTKYVPEEKEPEEIPVTEKYNELFKKYKGQYIVLGLISTLLIALLILAASLFI